MTNIQFLRSLNDVQLGYLHHMINGSDDTLTGFQSQVEFVLEQREAERQATNQLIVNNQTMTRDQLRSFIMRVVAETPKENKQ